MSIQSITLNSVRSAYSGAAKKCCCGCRGKHVYQRLNRIAAGESRGYIVDDNEINDACVARILKKIKSNSDSVHEGDHVFLEVNKKIYIVYLVN